MTTARLEHGGRPPNVVVITVDQWPAKALGCAGHPVVETPTLDALARIGRRFDHAYAECPICIPSRRTLMTGVTARRHGDRIFQTALQMPDLPTLADCFAAAGYQSAAIGKLHVFPKRDRIGFDEAIIAEEGRDHIGGDDDYDVFLSDNGHAGEQFLHGMGNNEFLTRPWHLPEHLHVTNWITKSACRTIKRRDPRKPGLWYVSYTHPHPPLAPLQAYLDGYPPDAIDPPLGAAWAEADDAPYPVRAVRNLFAALGPKQIRAARRAAYALSTHIDHQIRVVIGTLREEGLLKDTILLFCSDHGDMLGDFGLFAKRLMYQSSVRVPMILVAPQGSARLDRGVDRDRLVGLQDVMPTLLDLAGLPIPASCDGLSMIGDVRRDVFYGEVGDNARASRMIVDGRHKLIWYPAGNRVQLFDLDTDADERDDVAGDPDRAELRRHLECRLIDHLYGVDLAWIDGDRLVGFPAPTDLPEPGRGLSGQRGLHYPQIPQTDPAVAVGAGGD
jgi:arylsulfatase A-like enzyme